jgi:hypothetical protein
MSFFQYAKAYAVLLVLLGIGATIISRPDLAGETRLEYRERNVMPAVPKSVGDFIAWPGRFDAFANDHFPARSQLIQAVAATAYALGTTISPQVVIGEPPWLFLNKQSDVIEEHRGLSTISSEGAVAWARHYKSWHEHFAAMGIKLVFVIVPNKHTIYAEHLPAHLKPVGPSIRQSLIRNMSMFLRQAAAQFSVARIAPQSRELAG